MSRLGAPASSRSVARRCRLRRGRATLAATEWACYTGSTTRIARETKLVRRDRQRPPWWLWGLAMLLIGVSFYPTLEWLVTTWVGSPHYSHGALVPLVSLFLAWRLEHRAGVEEQQGARGDRSFLGGALAVGAGLSLHLIAAMRRQHLMSAGALVFVLAGVVLAWAGSPTLRRQAFPLAFASLMIPLPWMESSTPYLARRVASVAGSIARAMGVQVDVVGAQIELPDVAFIVGAPCSGISSLAALVTLAVVYAFLVRGPLSSRLALVILAAPIALLANLARVCLMIAMAHYVGAVASLRFFHDWSSPLLLLVALMLLIVAGKGLRCGGIRPDI